MRLLIFSFVFALTMAAADPASVAGTWQIKRSAAGRESQAECTFTQSGGVLGGACVSERGKSELTGKVEGAKVTWAIKTDSEGGAVTVVYSGKVSEAGKMAGSVLAVEFGVEGEFSGVLVK